MSNLIYDVAIIGAGPAGSSAAFTLEKAGFNIIIMDKSRFPRPKPCAGVLPPRIFSEISIPERIIERPLSGYRIISPSKKVLDTNFPKPGAIVRRETFDDYLLKKLKGRPKIEHILNFKNKKDCIELKAKKNSFSARIVIAADGANSIFQKRMANRGNNKKNSRDLGLGVQTEISLPNEIITQRIGNRFWVFYIFNLGYAWLSPLRDCVKVGVGGVSSEIGNGAKNVLNEFLKMEMIKDIIGHCKIENFEAHQIPMKGPYDELTWDRILLCGDAGGFVFPGTGEGVYYAIKSGRIAAETAISALKTDDFAKKTLDKSYSHELKKNGLISLRDVNFMENVLSSPEKAERYIQRLKQLAIN